MNKYDDFLRAYDVRMSAPSKPIAASPRRKPARRVPWPLTMVRNWRRRR